MQVIYVLGNDLYRIFFFELRYRFMCFVGLGSTYSFPALIIQLKDQLRVPSPPLRRGYFFYIKTFPKCTCITKGWYPAFGTYSCTGEDYYFLHGNCKLLYLITNSLILSYGSTVNIPVPPFTLLLMAAGCAKGLP